VDHGVFPATGAPTDVCATPAIFSTAGPTWLVCDASQLVMGVCVYSCCFITVCGELTKLPGWTAIEGGQ
jgi:hypothetical protein